MKAIYKTGFIGYGNMAQAIVNGILENDIVPASNVYAFDIDSVKLKDLADRGGNPCESAEALAEQCEIIFLCVKPNILPEIAPNIHADGKSVISIAAGIKSEKIRKYFHNKAKVMRIMPNTPMLVGKGAICVETPHDLESSIRDFIYSIFMKMGLIKEVAADQMDAVTGVSGSGPAYVYMFIDAVARAGAENGLDYNDALDLAIQTFAGAAHMLKQTKEDPQVLIDQVCSPGGTTIEAIRSFKEDHVCDIIHKGIDKCVHRSRELSE